MKKVQDFIDEFPKHKLRMFFPDLTTECEEEWNERYAILAEGRVWNADGSDYFDADLVAFDFTELLKTYFGVSQVFTGSPPVFYKGLVIYWRRYGTGEVEFYYQ